MGFIPEKITDCVFACPGYVMKRPMNYEALSQLHPALYQALMQNPIFKGVPVMQESNFRTISRMFDLEYTNSDTLELSPDAPTVGEDSCRLDELIDELEQAGRRHPLTREQVPFLEYSRRSRAGEDYVCVTADYLCIQGGQAATAQWIALEDILAIAMTDNALIINGISYPLSNAFSPLDEKYIALTYMVGMVLAMKYRTV